MRIKLWRLGGVLGCRARRGRAARAWSGWDSVWLGCGTSPAYRVQVSELLGRHAPGRRRPRSSRRRPRRRRRAGVARERTGSSPRAVGAYEQCRVADGWRAHDLRERARNSCSDRQPGHPSPLISGAAIEAREHRGIDGVEGGGAANLSDTKSSDAYDTILLRGRESEKLLCGQHGMVVVRTRGGEERRDVGGRRLRPPLGHEEVADRVEKRHDLMRGECVPNP